MKNANIKETHDESLKNKAEFQVKHDLPIILSTMKDVKIWRELEVLDTKDDDDDNKNNENDSDREEDEEEYIPCRFQWISSDGNCRLLYLQTENKVAFLTAMEMRKEKYGIVFASISDESSIVQSSNDGMVKISKSDKLLPEMLVKYITPMSVLSRLVNDLIESFRRNDKDDEQNAPITFDPHADDIVCWSKFNSDYDEIPIDQVFVKGSNEDRLPGYLNTTVPKILVDEAVSYINFVIANVQCWKMFENNVEGRYQWVSLDGNYRLAFLNDTFLVIALELKREKYGIVCGFKDCLPFVQTTKINCGGCSSSEVPVAEMNFLSQDESFITPEIVLAKLLHGTIKECSIMRHKQ